MSLSNVFKGNFYFKNNKSQFSSIIGGGIPGFIPQPTQDSNNFDEYARIRFYLREAYNTKYGYQITNQGLPAKINSPFRLANNAGDPLSRKYYSCGGTPSQIKRPQNNGLKSLYGNINNLCDNSGVEASNCNGKFVYDSSDYIQYKKNNAINKNYNDLSNGGNDYSAQQSKYRSIRRF
jgi:hypothetical protein